MGVYWARCVKYSTACPLFHGRCVVLCADKLSQPKRKPFFEKHHEAIFYVFLASFTGSETHFQSRSERSQLVTVCTLICVSILLSIHSRHPEGIGRRVCRVHFLCAAHTRSETLLRVWAVWARVGRDAMPSSFSSLDYHHPSP